VSATPAESIPQLYRVHITCEACGRRHSLEQRYEQLQTLHLVCHDCERCLRAGVDDGEPPPEAQR
jgi:DNA replicative helicase MCM subunit Mcm2 (Cdc46/Mcm family)